jgi:chromate transporter
MPASWRRVSDVRVRKVRWLAYLVAGALSAATIGPYLVLVLIGCGLIEIVAQRGLDLSNGSGRMALFLVPATSVPMVAGGLAALSWVAFKVGALSYGGGFVIIPLMQHDAVVTYHWMTGAQFLNAVALGQVTPGPVVQTVSVVGYAAGGLGGGLLAACIAFAPSFFFIMAGASHFDRLRANARVQAFLTGTGAAVIGAIAGSTIPLGRELTHVWQLAILALAALWLLGLRRGVVSALLACGALGVIAVMVGAPT